MRGSRDTMDRTWRLILAIARRTPQGPLRVHTRPYMSGIEVAPDGRLRVIRKAVRYA